MRCSRRLPSERAAIETWFSRRFSPAQAAVEAQGAAVVAMVFGECDQKAMGLPRGDSRLSLICAVEAFSSWL